MLGITGIPVRFLIWDDEAKDVNGEEGGDLVECNEADFIARDNASNRIYYERHTVFANGVDQIVLTKW